MLFSIKRQNTHMLGNKAKYIADNLQSQSTVHMYSWWGPKAMFVWLHCYLVTTASCQIWLTYMTCYKRTTTTTNAYVIKQLTAYLECQWSDIEFLPARRYTSAGNSEHCCSRL